MSRRCRGLKDGTVDVIATDSRAAHYDARNGSSTRLRRDHRTRNGIRARHYAAGPAGLVSLPTCFYRSEHPPGANCSTSRRQLAVGAPADLAILDP